MKQFKKVTDGFGIAELDLKERGMGELAGARQSGGLHLRYTDLSLDAELVALSRRLAHELLDVDPALTRSENAMLKKRIEQRHERGIELFRIG